MSERQTIEELEQQMTICDHCGEEVFPEDLDDCMADPDGLCIHCGKSITANGQAPDTLGTL